MSGNLVVNDACDQGRLRGRVRQTLHLKGDPAGQVIFDGHNLVVDAALEIMIQALMGQERIHGVSFSNTGGLPVTKGIRSARSPVAFAATGSTTDTQPFASRDESGLRSIGTWTAVLEAAADLTYDTLGLVSTSDVLFAATSFAPVNLLAGSTIAVQWTILMRGS